MSIADWRLWAVIVEYDSETDRHWARFHSAKGHWLEGLKACNTTRVGAIAQLESAAQRAALQREEPE